MGHPVSKHTFYLRTLNEVSRELSALVQPRKILETFLLMSMGSLGLTSGFVVVFNTGTRQATMVCRGIEPPREDRLSGEWAAIHSRYAPAGQTAAESARMIFRGGPGVAPGGWPPDITGLIFWQIDEQYAGMFGIGPDFEGSAPEPDGVELLLNLTAILSGALGRALSTQQIHTLDADLHRQQRALQNALGEAESARSNLQQTVSDLKTRYLERVRRINPIDFLIIGLVSLVVGLLFNHFSPNGIDLIPERFFHAAAPTITPSAAQSLVARNEAVVIDARPQEFFNQKHIAGALNIPPALFDIAYMIKLGGLDQDKPIIVYGRSISRRYDETVARRLALRDHSRVMVLAGGLSAWASEGYAIER